ncbi:MAG: Rnase Y domain-containing protein, partial [Acidobacteriota bacterium]
MGEPMLAIQLALILAQGGGSWIDRALAGGLGTVIGIIGFYLVKRFWDRARFRAAREEAERTIEQAAQAAEVVLKKAEVEAQKAYFEKQEQLRGEADAMRAEIRETEKRLAKREDNLEAKLDTLVTKERNLEQTQEKLNARLEEVKTREEEADQLVARRREELLRVSGMSAEDARQAVLTTIEHELEHEAAEMIERSVATAKDEAVRRSREITLTAIQRYAAEHTAESTVSTIDLPSDDMKGRVIGREGRNIRAFERATGVDVIVDDTPGVVLVSAFDPVRKEIARASMERLIQDGRIHPGRIEELVELVTKEVHEDILESGKRAAVEANVGGLHRKQLDLLGRLKFRTSYGQNVLQHSLEVAFLCQSVADELGLDGRLARRCGLLHDI